MKKRWEERKDIKLYKTQRQCKKDIVDFPQYMEKKTHPKIM